MDRALAGVVGAERAPVTVTVLPEGDVRAIHLRWGESIARDLEVTVGDCQRLPEMIALATERVLAELPSGLDVPPGRWVASVGGALGLGAVPWAPRVDGWFAGRPHLPVAPELGGAVVVGGQALGDGGVVVTGADLRVGASVVTGGARLGASALAGGRVGVGVALADRRAAVLPRVAARLEAGSAAPTRVWGAVEIPVVAPTWTVAGGPSASEPWVTASLGIGRTIASR